MIQSIFEQFGKLIAFMIRTILQLPIVIFRPSVWIPQFIAQAAGMTLIVAVVGYALGIVVWMHVGDVLAQFDQQSQLPALLMIAVVIEFGPISVGLIAAGRLGSGIAAELAAMNVTEQQDALELIGISPMKRLVAPRVLACVLVLPPLAVLTDWMALLGGYSAEFLAGDLSWSLYMDRSIQYLDLHDSIYSTLKTAVFGFLVGTISCWFGQGAERSTQAVGQAATNAVVASILAILLANIFLVRLIHLF